MYVCVSVCVCMHVCACLMVKFIVYFVLSEERLIKNDVNNRYALAVPFHLSFNCLVILE